MLRFAPSPTGDLHIGNLRVALFNFIQSQQVKEPLTIRIEDMDSDRNIEGKDKEILGLLELFGVSYESVSYQSENKKRHQLMALQLINTKRAFNCFCTAEQLKKDQEAAKQANRPYRYSGVCEKLSAEETIDNMNPFSVRIKKPITDIDFTDKIQGDLHFEPNDVDNFLVLNQDKTPAYIFASAVDDMISDISLVIRGEDHLENAPRQMAARAALGYTKSIEYAHLPMILNASGEKMGKDDEASNVKWLIEQGILPMAIMNYLVALGNKVPKEIFTLAEAIEFFDIDTISKEASTFDMDTLLSINREHLKIMDDLEISRYVGFADADIGRAAKVYLDDVFTTRELKEKIAAIFAPKSEDGLFGETVKQFKKLINNADHLSTFSELKDYIMNNSDANADDFSKAIRIVLTGAEEGPDLDRLYPHIKNYLSEIVR
jgi:glutamyl-tRNA synthetase